MANITQEINQINTAVYGADVRSALANGLTAVNTEVDELNSNVQNFETNVDGQVSTLSNQVGAVGTTVTNAVLDISNIKKQIDTTNTNAQTAVQQVNSLIEEANKNGTVGLPLTGGTLTGAINVNDGKGTTTVDGDNILMNGQQVMYIDSSNNLNLGNTNLNSVTSDAFFLINNSMSAGSTITACSTAGDTPVTLGSGIVQINNLTALDGISKANTLKVNTGGAFSGGVEVDSPVNITAITKGVEFDGARILYLDSNNNLWLNSADNMSNGSALGNTYVAGNMELSVSTTTEAGYIINNNNVLTANGSNLDINQSGGYTSVNINGIVKLLSDGTAGGNLKYDGTQVAVVNTQNNNFLSLANNGELIINSNNVKLGVNGNNNLVFNTNVEAPNLVGINVNQIQNTDDFNNYLTQGIYYTSSSATASEVKNNPTYNACFIEVINCDYGNSNGFIYQRVVDMYNNVYYRALYGYQGTWSSWSQACSQPANASSSIAVKPNGQAYATELLAIGKATTNLSLENNQLKAQNKALGGQVTALTMQNAELNKQVKSLAQTMVAMQLKQTTGGK